MSQSIVRRGLALPLLALLALPLHAGAQESALFTWTGRVDRQVRLTMQGGNVRSDAVRGEEYNGRFRVSSALPAQEGTVRVVVNGGRGDVSVLEQPNARNNYTTVIRVSDRSSGADRYQLSAYFTPSGGGRWARGVNGNAGGMNNGRNGDNGRYGNNGRYGSAGRGQAMLHWSGMVDATAEIVWQGGMVRQRALTGNTLRAVRSSVSGAQGARGQQDGQATVAVAEGRGQVEVVQQPSMRNGWTTIIRVNDPQGGYGQYSFDVSVQ